jgi:hypothetical protein
MHELGLALREEHLIATAENADETKIEKWDRSNRL